MSRLRHWTTANLATQGYSLSEHESRSLAIGLRFPTAVCLALVVVATLLAAGATAAGLVLGALLVAACTAVTVFNLCLPSVTFESIARVRA